MKRVAEKCVHGRVAEWLAARGCAGVTVPLPWVTLIIYWMAPGRLWPTSEGRLHERQHAWQAEMHGWFGWWCRYVWYTVRYGYRANPLEVSARRAAGQP